MRERQIITLMIIDLPKLYCPMGCGNTLHVRAGAGYGGIVCLARGCPDDKAAQKILSESEHRDIVTFADGYFSVLHPLRERVGAALTDCPVAEACARVSGPPDSGDGRFRAWLDESGRLVLKRIEA